MSRWIQNWFEDREQKVVWNGEGSKLVSNLEWCSQRAVLGLLLILIYLNDIDEGVASKILRFADDKKLCRAVGNLNQVKSLKNDLQLLMEWSAE